MSGRMCSLEGNDIWCHPGLGRLIDALHKKIPGLTVATSVAPSRPRVHDHRLSLDRSSFIPLPHLPSTVAGLRQDRACRRAIAEVEGRSDVTVVQLPFSPPSALAPAKRPRVYHVCADVPNVVRASPYYQGLRRVAAVGLAELIHLWTRRLVRRPATRVVTNGRALLDRLGTPPGISVVSSSMLDAEIGSATRRRPSSAPFRVLFVGYLRPEKGIDILMEAYRRLLSDLPDAELMLVGEQDLVEGGAARALRASIDALEGRGKVISLGHKTFGPELFAEYADADVLALPSRSEGTPRVLVEARAFGCPVVATAVGGIPTSVTDGEDGLLIPPNDPAALHAALLRVAHDKALRARLTTHGLATARRSTVDAFADQMLEEVGQLMGRGAAS